MGPRWLWRGRGESSRGRRLGYGDRQRNGSAARAQSLGRGVGRELRLRGRLPGLQCGREGRATATGVVSRPTTFPPAWLPLVERAGGVGALATALGVPLRTLSQWARGERSPGKFARAHVEAWTKRRGLASPWGSP